MALAGSYAGFATALLLCFAGVLRGDASDGLIVLEETRFHFGRVPCVAFEAVQNRCHGLHIGQTTTSSVGSEHWTLAVFAQLFKVTRLPLLLAQLFGRFIS